MANIVKLSGPDEIRQKSLVAEGAQTRLLPLQEAMVLQGLQGDRPGADLEQIVIDLGRGLPAKEAIEASLQRLCLAHPILTCRFALDDRGHPVLCRATDDWRPGLFRHDTTATEEAAEDWLLADRRSGFDLLAAPAWRVAAISLGQDRTRLVITIHHALADLPAMARLAADLLSDLFGLEDLTPDCRSGTMDEIRARLWARHDPAAAEAHFRMALDAPPATGLVTGLVTGVPRRKTTGPMAQLRAGIAAKTVSRLRARLGQAADENGKAPRLIHALQLLWALLLARQSGEASAIFGLTFAGRTGPDTDAVTSLQGSLIATLPQRIDLAGVKTVDAALARIVAATTGLRAHHCAGPDEILKALGPGQALSRLYETMLVYSPQDLSALLAPVLDQLGGGQVRLMEEGRQPLTLAVYGETALEIVLEHDPALVPPALAAALLARLVRLAGALAACAPGAALGDLDMLTADERAELESLASAPLPGTGTRRAVCVSSGIERLARDEGEAPALVLPDGERMCRARLDARVNGMARDLAALGAGPGSVIALNMRWSVDQVAALLAVFKLGAAALPLDPAMPELERNLRATEAGTAVVIGDDGLLGLDVPCLKPRGSLALRAPQRPEYDPGRLAYVIHTSGSSGRPKGVMGSAGGLAAHAASIIGLFGLGPSDRVLQFASPAFDVALEEILPTLLAGASLVLRPEEEPESLTAFLRYIDRQGVTVANLPAGFWHLLVAELAEGRARLPKSLRLVVTGSERVDPGALASWQVLQTGVDWINCYGPTEATITATAYRPAPGQGHDPSRAVPIGRPLAHVRCHILAFDGSLAPPGTAGELVLSGPGVALGYLGRGPGGHPNFRAAPDGQGDRAYATGDRASWDGEGQLAFHGRRDRQVKVRGHRIDLEEIERQLLQYPGVEEVHVGLVGKDAAARLVAWAGGAALAGNAAKLAKLESLVSERFAAAARPQIVALAALPRRVNGKIDPTALPIPGAGPEEEPMGMTAETDSLTYAVARVMGRVLGLERLHPDGDIRDHGANSLSLLRMTSVLGAEFGRVVQTADLYRNPTPRRLAAWLGHGNAAGSGMIALQAKGNGIPFIAVHMLGDGQSLFRPLAAALGPDVPVWGLSYGAPRSIEDVDIPRMAERYAAEVMAAFPTGPVALGAVSLSAYFAYELAQRLIASGRQVRLMAVFDAVGPDGRPPLEGLPKLAAHLRQIRRHGIGHIRRVLALRRDRRNYDAELTRAGESDVTGAALVRANIRAVDDYQPQPLDCPIIVFRAAESFWDSPRAIATALGWRSVARAGVELVDAPGDHFGILARENVAVIAADLARRLAAR